jgi:23S rRNA (cytosine1962-C5)-methyltransferase
MDPASKPAPAAKSAPARLDLPAPYAVASRRAGDNLRRGHLWVYATEIEQIELGGQPGKLAAPALIPVVDSRGILLGTALYSPASQIALRLVSRELVDGAQWLTLVAERLRAAIARRKPLLTADTNACRLVFSEADNLPGIIVDKYADIVVLQLLAKGLDSGEIRTICAEVLREELGSEHLTIWERPDPRIRELEGLSAPTAAPLYSATPDAPVASTIFRLNGLSFHFDVNSGQKTGAFLDQRENYAAAARWAEAKGATGKVLDVCTYQGGFALHLARVCREVTGVDASRASLEVAERNLAENRAALRAEVEWVEGDAFEVLRGWAEPKSGSEADRAWDLIVLDPPAFAKTKRAVEGALRGYKELNLRALRMLRVGGLLVTCSCSHHVTWGELEAVVADAAVDAHRRVTLLERRGAAQDHPVLLNLPESEYLKCLICEVD